MKRLLTTLQLMLIATAIFAQKQITVTAPIEKATVFLTGAQLYHSTNVSLPKGQSEIIIEGLSSSLDPNSVQGGGKGDFTILDIQYRLFYPEPIANPVILTETDKKKRDDNNFSIEFEKK